MRKWITFLMTLLVGSVSYANASTGADVSFEAGYRRDRLSWTLEVPECDPFFRTQSKFKDISIFQLGVKARTTLGCNFYVRGELTGGWILDGDFEEETDVLFSFSDIIPGVFSDIDQFEFGFTSRDTIDGRYVFDFNIAVGYPFYFCDCSMYLAPVIGWSYDEQNIEIEDHDRPRFSTFNGFLVEGSDNGCCHDKFISRWYGPFVGLDFVYRPCNECWGFFAELEYHWAHHKTKRHDVAGFSGFDRFDHNSRHAHGWVFGAGIEYAFCNCWNVGLNVKYQDWRSHDHHRCNNFFSDFFSSSGGVKSHSSWHSFAVNATVGMGF